MAKIYDAIDDGLRAFIEAQHVFFIATAPAGAGGHINLSPKGLDSLRILGPREVLYLDFAGSGVETIAHVRQNGRVVIMVCGFDGPPRILRLHGRGQVIEPQDAAFGPLQSHFPAAAGVRAIIQVAVERIGDSCGHGVPLYRYEGQRSQLPAWAERKGESGLIEYQREKNAASIDGLPGLRWPAVNFRRATWQDLSAILALLEANLVDNLAVEERQSGFLSAKFTRAQLEQMAEEVGIIVADDGRQILGFLCASQLDFDRQFPLLAAMLAQFDRVDYGGKPLGSHPLFLYGPVCVDRGHRGRGLLRGLYEALKQEVAGKYEVGVCFVATENPHSLRAHVDGLGMADVGEFEFEGRGYKILAFNVTAEQGR